VLLFVAVASTALAAQTVLDFEDLPDGTVVTNQYGAKGVHSRGSLTSAQGVRATRRSPEDETGAGLASRIGITCAPRPVSAGRVGE